MESKRAKAIWAKLGDHCQLYRKSRRAQLATWGRESRNLCSGKLQRRPVRSHGSWPLFHNGQRGSTATLPSAESHRSILVGPLAEILDIGTSTYNGGVLSVQKRFSHDFSMVGNYTYSHCIDNGESGSVYAASGWLTMSQPQQIGNCSFDHRNQLTFNGVYRSPEFHSEANGYDPWTLAGSTDRNLPEWRLAHGHHWCGHRAGGYRYFRSQRRAASESRAGSTSLCSTYDPYGICSGQAVF